MTDIMTRLIMRALIINPDGHVLLGRETDDERWSLPGGHAAGWNLIASLEREIIEETGYQVHIGPLLLTAHTMNIPEGAPASHYTLMIFHARITGGAPRVDGLEISELDWFPVGELPPLSTTRVLADQIQFAHDNIHDRRPTTTVMSMLRTPDTVDIRIHHRHCGGPESP